MARTRAKELPSAWIAPLVRALAGRELEVTRSAVAVARAAPPSKDAAADLHAALLRVARDSASPLDVRIDALAALRGGLTRVDQDLFDLLRSGLEPAQPISIRVAAAAGSRKSPPRAETTAGFDGTAREHRPAGAAAALARLRSRQRRGAGARDARGASSGRRVAPASGRTSFARVWRSIPSPCSSRARRCWRRSMSMPHGRQQRLEELLAAGNDGKDGDVRRGQAVFNGPKAACLSCHTIGYLGGKIGPDLTRIGQIRSERDLLEAISVPERQLRARLRIGRRHDDIGCDAQRSAAERSDRRGRAGHRRRRGDADPAPGDRRHAARHGVGHAARVWPNQLSRQELTDLLAFLKATRSGAQ